MSAVAAAICGVPQGSLVPVAASLCRESAATPVRPLGSPVRVMGARLGRVGFSLRSFDASDAVPHRVSTHRNVLSRESVSAIVETFGPEKKPREAATLGTPI